MAMHIRYTEVIQRTGPRPAASPQQSSKPHTRELGSSCVLRQLFLPETPQTHREGAAAFQCLPDATALLRHQPEPSTPQC